MPVLTPSHHELIVNNLNEFITTLKNSGYNISTTHYVLAHQLLNTLAAQQQLPTDANQLSQLLMPLLCCCEKEQQDFPRSFSFWLGNLPVDDNQTSDLKPPIAEAIGLQRSLFRWSKIASAIFANRPIILVFVLLLGLCSFVFQEAIQQQIQTQIASYFPIELPPEPENENTKKTIVKNPLAVIPETIETKVEKQIAQNPNEQFKKYGEFVGFALTMLLTIIACWWGWLYLQTHRFLTRHSVSSPPQLKSFFLNKPRPLFALLDFTFTAQQLHKHRHIASNYLDPQPTIKQTLAKAGIFTPCYQTLRAVPEYLVLIDRSSFKDQLAASVNDLIQQLLAIGLFIECFYFDEDPRRCYRQGETRPQALDGLLANYPSHRLLVFSDSGHFIDPSTGQLNQWASKFAHSQQPVLFTFTSLQAFGVREAMLHEAGFVVLPWDDKGFETLLQHFDEEREAVDFVGTEENTAGGFVFPVLVRRRAQRFLERHRPNEELVTRLLQELKSYLGADGFFWLAACAAYPQLESQLTLHLGYALLGEENFEQSLFIRLLRLPWFRHGFMPDWLRWLLLADLSVEQDNKIRAVIYQLLLNASAEQEGKSFNLDVAKEGEVLHWAKRIVKLWTRRVSKGDELKDFVFQSFLQGKLSVKAPESFVVSRKNGYLLGLAVVVLMIAGFMLITSYFNTEPKVTTEMVTEKINFTMVSLKGDCFQMGSPKTEAERQDDEQQHEVCVDDFQLGQTEVTKGQFNAFVSATHYQTEAETGDGCYAWTGTDWKKDKKYNWRNVGFTQTDEHPVVCVSWNDAMAYITWLNQKTGKSYRLPTEAEWEYAARAGTKTPFYTGACLSSTQANYDGNTPYNNCAKGDYKQHTVTVGSYPANAWGLSDMAGNVWEWTCSAYVANYDGSEKQCISKNDANSSRVLRGGSWFSNARGTRSAYRRNLTPDDRSYYFGFRFALGQTVAGK